MLKIEMIPFGKENAITRGRLVEMTGLSDSQVRIELSKLKRQYPICSSARYEGYFRPRSTEKNEALATREELAHKAMTILSQMKALDNFVTSQEEELWSADSVDGRFPSTR